MTGAPAAENLGAFLGRFHPLWVHLPIGILVLLALLEALGLAKRLPGLGRLPVLEPGQRALILYLGAAFAVLAAALGWLLAHDGDYEAPQVSLHQWLGVAAAASAVLVLAVRRIRWLYGPALTACLVLLVFAAHAGATLTHGSGYLTARMPATIGEVLGIHPPKAPEKPKPPDYAHARVYADVVEPILRDRCFSCHGPDKSNGGLRMDTWELLAKGGKHGPVIGSADPLKGALLVRIDLPPETKEHMPPSGKAQLGEDDLAILEWWAYAGSPREKPISSLEVPEAVAEIVEGRLGGAPSEPIPNRAATLSAAARISRELGIIIRPLSPDGPWLDVNARIQGKGFGDRELARLAPIARSIVWLDLGGTAVTDPGLVALGPMHHLARLHLDQSQVTDAGLYSLKGLRSLEYLNLRGTAITDTGLGRLRVLPRLRQLYVWQTAATPAAVKALGDSLTNGRRIARMEGEKAELSRLIDEERFQGNTGESLRPADPLPKNTPK